jgi:cytochrome c oxidase assembly protein subunit 15
VSLDRLADRRTLRLLGWGNLLANVLLVVTGGAVRLTASGLGCPTWPRCHDGDFTPQGELNVHSAIEFGNRMLTFVLTVVAVAALAAAIAAVRRDGRRALLTLARVVLFGIPVQAVIGGISVLTELNPWVVSLHLVTSMAIIGVATLFVFRVDRPVLTTARGPLVGLAWANFVTAWLVLYVGTVVTGAGPHAGDKKSARNGLSALQTAQIHADLVCLLLGLTVGLLFAAYLLKQDARPAWLLLGVELSQALVGWVQYFTHLPIVLVGFHMLGAATISAAVTWALLRVRHPDPQQA